MSPALSLFLHLLGVAAVLLLGLGGHWTWLHLRAQRLRRASATPHSPTDWSDLLADLSTSGEDASAAQSPPPQSASSTPQASAHSGAQGEGLSQCDARIDCLALLEADELHSGQYVLSLLPQTHRVGSKSWVLEGRRGVLPASDAHSHAWEPVAPEGHYSSLQLGLQLVNRHGAMSDLEYSRFAVLVQHLATGMNASVVLPDMHSEVQRAHELEQFFLAHNIKLCIHVHARSVAWSYAYVEQQVLKAGFVAGAIAGRWVMGPGAGNMVALLIESYQAFAAQEHPVAPVDRVTLMLDVPQVSEQWRPFEAMCDAAIRLCATMEGQMRDESGLEVDAAALSRTAHELQGVYHSLRQAGLAAGSASARRLFA